MTIWIIQIVTIIIDKNLNYLNAGYPNRILSE